jgi:hypothetical protein
VKLIPSKNFGQEQLLSIYVSIVAGDKSMQPRRLQEVMNQSNACAHFISDWFSHC